MFPVYCCVYLHLHQSVRSRRVGIRIVSHRYVYGNKQRMRQAQKPFRPFKPFKTSKTHSHAACEALCVGFL